MELNKSKVIILLLIVFISILILISIEETSSLNTLSSSSSSFPTTTQLKILVGISTLPHKFRHRHFLREVYGIESAIRQARVDIKFVYCTLISEEHKLMISLEIMLYEDIIILDCEENTDEGKTYTFFSSLPEMFPSNSSYDYVLKVEDDSYFRLQNLVDALKSLPKNDLYYGRTMPCSADDPENHYMSGMGYLVSWDIVEWISVSDIPKRNTIGPEDKMFEGWLRDGDRGKNRHNAGFGMHDFPEPWTGCSHEIWPGTVAVHYLTDQEKWIQTLNYFNVTKGLKTTKLYHFS